MVSRIWAADAAAQLEHHDTAVTAAKTVAEQISEAARGLAPEESGDYLASIHVEIVNGPKGPVATVVADDPKALWIEYGTAPRENSAGAGRGELPAYRPIGNAVESLGLSLSPDRP